jgi:hypothetical protein
MQVTCGLYKRACTFHISSLFNNAHNVNFDAYANKLLSTVHLRYLSSYIHIIFIVKSLKYRVCM